MGDLLQLGVPFGHVPSQGVLESLNQQWLIVSIWRHFPAVHLQVDHGVSSPIVPFEFRGFELWRYRHVREPRHVGEVCVPKRVQPLHEPNLLLQIVNFAAQLGVFPFRLR